MRLGDRGRKLALLAATAVTAVTGVGAGTMIHSSPRTVKVQDIYVRNTSDLPDSDVTNAIPAFQTALDRDFRPYWQVTAKLHFAKTDDDIPSDAIVFYVQNEMDVEGALAYHYIDERGIPYARIGVGITLAYGFSWTVAFTHELWELLADPSIVRTAQGAVDPRIWALENADPVEDEQFAYHRKGANGTDVLISDFVTDAWFGAKTDQPYDFTRHVTEPYQILAGGYAQFWDGSSWQVVLGDKTRAQKAWLASEHAERAE